ncbi:MAG TPA: hypothetical protein VG943_12925 [Caulobacterales bacterium]|nr:hypothetical protein [Caulobacterales bacterium]
MGAIGRILLIIVAIVLVIGVGGYFVLPSTAAKTQSFSVPRPSAAVFARLSSTPANTQVAPGVTAKRVVSAANNVVVEELAFADGGSGRATYTVRPDGDSATHVDVKIERNLGANPVDRVQGLSGAPVATAAAAFFPAVTTDLNALPNASFAGLHYSVVQVEAQPFFYIQNCSPTDPESVESVVQDALVAVRAVMQVKHLEIAGPPIAVEPAVQNNQYCYQIGYPYHGTPPRVLAVGTAGTTPGGTALRVVYKGGEENVIHDVYDPLDALLASAHLDDPTTRSDDWPTYEVYHDDPTQPGGSHDREIYYVTRGDISALTAIAPPTPDAPAAATPAAAAAAAPSTTEPAAETTTATTTAAQ